MGWPWVEIRQTRRWQGIVPLLPTNQGDRNCEQRAFGIPGWFVDPLLKPLQPNFVVSQPGTIGHHGLRAWPLDVAKVLTWTTGFLAT